MSVSMHPGRPHPPGQQVESKPAQPVERASDTPAAREGSGRGSVEAAPAQSTATGAGAATVSESTSVSEASANEDAESTSVSGASESADESDGPNMAHLVTADTSRVNIGVGEPEREDLAVGSESGSVENVESDDDGVGCRIGRR